MNIALGGPAISVVALLRRADTERALRMHRRFVVRTVLSQWTEPRTLLVVPVLGIAAYIWWLSGPDRLGRYVALVLICGALAIVASNLIITAVCLAGASLSRRTVAQLADRVDRSASGSYALPLGIDEGGLVVGSGSGARRHRWDDFETVLVAEELLLLVGKRPLLIPLPTSELEPTLRDRIVRKLPSAE